VRAGQGSLALPGLCWPCPSTPPRPKPPATLALASIDHRSEPLRGCMAGTHTAHNQKASNQSAKSVHGKPCDRHGMRCCALSPYLLRSLHFFEPPTHTINPLSPPDTPHRDTQAIPTKKPCSHRSHRNYQGLCLPH